LLTRGLVRGNGFVSHKLNFNASTAFASSRILLLSRATLHRQPFLFHWHRPSDNLPWCPSHYQPPATWLLETGLRPVFLVIDSSFQGVGWILSQACKDNQRHPSRFGSIGRNEHESSYSRPKI
jgi:hypothetical protein